MANKHYCENHPDYEGGNSAPPKELMKKSMPKSKPKEKAKY